MDYILEFLKTENSVCVWEVSRWQRGAGRRRDVSGYILPSCQLVQGTQRNASDRASCMQQQYANCFAAVFSV